MAMASLTSTSSRRPSPSAERPSRAARGRGGGSRHSGGGLVSRVYMWCSGAGSNWQGGAWPWRACGVHGGEQGDHVYMRLEGDAGVRVVAQPYAQRSLRAERGYLLPRLGRTALYCTPVEKAKGEEAGSSCTELPFSTRDTTHHATQGCYTLHGGATVRVASVFHTGEDGVSLTTLSCPTCSRSVRAPCGQLQFSEAPGRKRPHLTHITKCTAVKFLPPSGIGARGRTTSPLPLNHTALRLVAVRGTVRACHNS